MSDSLDEMESDLLDDQANLHHIDSLGREYKVAPGTKPLDVDFEDYPYLRGLAVKILQILGKTEHLEYIDSGFVAFTKSAGRKESNRKTLYIHGVRTVVQCFFGRQIGYIIEATQDFEGFDIVEQIDALLTILYRIRVDREKPTGKFVSYDSFRGFDRDLSNVVEAMKNEIENES